MDQYYKVLGLDSNATKEEIKSSYRKMTKKHHPDLNPNDKNSEEKFKKVVEAYEFLTGKQKTKPQQPQGNPFGGGGNPFGLSTLALGAAGLGAYLLLRKK